MASPRSVIFFLFDETTGAPFTGATPTFDTRLDSSGSTVSAPVITELGGGAYQFTPVFPTNLSLAFIVNGGAGTNPRRQSLFLRPEDYDTDLLADIHAESLGKWQIFTTGPDANRIVYYQADGVTVLQKFDLFDSSGAPTTNNPFRRTPV